MDNADYELIIDIRDELRAIAGRIEELTDRLEEITNTALHGTRAVDLRCRAITKQGHQCSRRATGRGELAGYCKTHQPNVYVIVHGNGYRERRVEPPLSAPKV